jgi:hypothetical protein
MPGKFDFAVQGFVAHAQQGAVGHADLKTRHKRMFLNRDGYTNGVRVARC